MSKPPYYNAGLSLTERLQPKVSLTREEWNVFKRLCKDRYKMSASATIREFIRVCLRESPGNLKDH